MRNISIKWKFSLAFITLSLIIVGVYVYIATETFESDKISYIFDNEQAQLKNLSNQINQRLERVFFDGRSVLAGYDFTEKKLNNLGQNLFADQRDLLAIEIWDRSTFENLLKIEKAAGVIPTFDRKLASEVGHLDIQSLGAGRFLFLAIIKNANIDVLGLRIVAELKDLLPQFSNGSLILSQGEELISTVGSEIPSDMGKEILGDLNNDRSEKTMLKKFGKNKYLISSSVIKYGNLRLTSIINEDKALSALNVLFKKSLVFVGFSIFATILISIFLSSGLTYHLQILTYTAQKIGQGHFSSVEQFNSKDEVGVLSQAFAKMVEEIQRLLVETKDKARMESELKTAKLVQESLFPSEPNYKTGDIELSGLFVTSSECGGDWWYYFKRGEELFVIIADATGHGTPAALITSAARSFFSQVEISQSTLSEIAALWNRSIAACSKQKILMTAYIMKIDLPSGKVCCLNASHEPPFLLSKDGKIEPLLAPVNPRLGTLEENIMWEEYEFDLKAGDKIILYTDGLIGIQNGQGKVLSEKRIVRAIEKDSQSIQGAKALVDKIYAIFEDHRQKAPLSDDVTLVVVEKST